MAVPAARILTREDAVPMRDTKQRLRVLAHDLPYRQNPAWNGHEKWVQRVARASHRYGVSDIIALLGWSASPLGERLSKLHKKTQEAEAEMRLLLGGVRIGLYRLSQVSAKPLLGYLPEDDKIAIESALIDMGATIVDNSDFIGMKIRSRDGDGDYIDYMVGANSCAAISVLAAQEFRRIVTEANGAFPPGAAAASYKKYFDYIHDAVTGVPGASRLKRAMAVAVFAKFVKLYEIERRGRRVQGLPNSSLVRKYANMNALTAGGDPDEPDVLISQATKRHGVPLVADPDPLAIGTDILYGGLSGAYVVTLGAQGTCSSRSLYAWDCPRGIDTANGDLVFVVSLESHTREIGMGGRTEGGVVVFWYNKWDPTSCAVAGHVIFSLLMGENHRQDAYASAAKVQFEEVPDQPILS